MPVTSSSSSEQVKIPIPMSPTSTITFDPWIVTHRSGSLKSGCRFSFGFSWRGSGELFRGRQTVEILPAPLTINIGRQRPRVPSCHEKQQRKLSALSIQLEPKTQTVDVSAAKQDRKGRNDGKMPSIPGVVRVSDQRQNRKSVRLSLPVYLLAARLRCGGFFRVNPYITAGRVLQKGS